MTDGGWSFFSIGAKDIGAKDIDSSREGV